jgi:hypothetical protein
MLAMGTGTHTKPWSITTQSAAPPSRGRVLSHLPVDAEMHGGDAFSTHGHRNCLEWNAWLVNVARRLPHYWHCHVTDYIVSRHVIAEGCGLETCVASDMFAEAEQMTHDTSKRLPRNMHAMQGTPRSWPMDSLHVVFRMSTRLGKPMIT